MITPEKLHRETIKKQAVVPRGQSPLSFFIYPNDFQSSRLDLRPRALSKRFVEMGIGYPTGQHQYTSYHCPKTSSCGCPTRQRCSRGMHLYFQDLRLDNCSARCSQKGYDPSCMCCRSGEILCHTGHKLLLSKGIAYRDGADRAVP